MMEFLLQRFGGGGETQTTSREIPAQSANEAELEDALLQYARTSMGGAYGALGNAMRLSEQTFNPEWEQLYNDYVSRNDTSINSYTKLYDDKLKSFDSETEDLLDEYRNRANGYLSDYEGNVGSYNNDIADYIRQNQDATNQYNRDVRNALGENVSSLQNALSKYNSSMNRQSGKWDDLVNGVLPSAYATNRQNALNADLRGTVGNAVNSLGNRGIMNSSVTNKALGDISQNASDTLYKNYLNDLSMEADLLGRQGQTYKDIYDASVGNANNIYGNRMNSYNGIMNQANTLYGNQVSGAGGILGANTNLYDRQMSNIQSQYDTGYNRQKDSANLWANGLNSWIGNAFKANDNNFNAAATAQSASYQPVTQMLDYSNQLMAPAQNMYNQMYSGRMGTGSTTTTTSDGGGRIFPVIGSLGAAAITACFTGNTLVTTPTGYKYIKDIQAGDEVLSVSNGKIVPKKVERVNEPVEADTIDVYFDNGTVWHTTGTQRTFDGKHFAYCHVGASAVVHGGGYAGVKRVIPAGKELVYDFTVEGFAGENVFFANDVAAEGMGD